MRARPIGRGRGYSWARQPHRVARRPRKSLPAFRCPRFTVVIFLPDRSGPCRDVQRALRRCALASPMRNVGQASRSGRGGPVLQDDYYSRPRPMPQEFPSEHARVFLTAPWRRDRKKRVRGGPDCRDGLAVERESLGRPSRSKSRWLLLFRRSDRKSVVLGKSVSVRVVLGGRRIIKKKTT